MLRQSSSRNQRSKGVRVKHILQICMLLAVCFWLIYQVKHSHDKRKHFEESDAELSEKFPKFDEGLKLGRKDLHPRDEEHSEQSAHHEKIDDEEMEDEVDETKNETQEELKRKRKEEGLADIEALLDGTVRGEEDAGGRGGDDDIDEQELDKGEVDGEANEDEDILEGDKDVEKEEENENEEKDGNEEEHQLEDDQDHDQDRNGRNTHEAREEHYKGDDASSAVVHVAQNTLNGELDVREHGDSSNETEVGKEQSSNATNLAENGNEVTSPELEDVPIKNDTNEVSRVIVDSILQNSSGQVLEMTPEVTNSTKGLSDDKSLNTTVMQNLTNNSDVSSAINGMEYNLTTGSNATDSNMEQDEISNSTMNGGFSAADLVGDSKLSTSTNLTKSQTTYENDNLMEYKPDSEGDSILSSLNDDETLRDPLISELEDKQRESLIDLDTLPEIRTEGTDSDDAATE